MAVAPPTVLVAARAGPLRDSLKLFLLTLARSCRVLEVGDPEALALALIRHRPLLALVDYGLAQDGMSSLMGQLGAEAAGCRWLVLTDSPLQQREALAAGADEAMLKGILAEKLFGTIEQLLGPPRNEAPDPPPLGQQEACG